MVKFVRVIIDARSALARRLARKVATGEAVLHFCYGVAIFTEAHDGITIYSVAALGLGAVALIGALIGEGD